MPKYVQCPDCEASFADVAAIPPHRFCGKPCPGGLNVSPFADLPESPKRDQALERWAKA